MLVIWRRSLHLALLITALTPLTACGPPPPPPVTQPPVRTPSTPQATREATVLPTASATVPVITTLDPPASPVTNDGPSAAPRLPPVEKALVTHGDRSVANVALTFDACQTPQRPSGYDEAIIDILTETGTPATLFLGGLWMQSHPRQTEALAENPLFELGNHSWSHPDFAEISPEEMSAEILQTQNLMHQLTGRQPKLFRLPFGTYTDEVLAVVAQHGLRTIQWDVVTGDPDPNVTADDIVNAVTSRAKNGSIVIMHMNTRGWHTAEALPDILKSLTAAGFNFVTVTELLELQVPSDSCRQDRHSHDADGACNLTSEGTRIR